ncbi:MAG TPA: aldehyde dehydrogenase family protein [Actinomycetaceae bacterium]|nr:aldehyde dehydrogenase family protein [Actinomycetaceae bacterium]
MTTTTHTVEPAHLGQLIGGEERAATQTIEVRNPGRLGELVGTVADGDVADVEAAVAAADAAAPGWAATSPQERVAIFERIADAIEAQIDTLAPLVARENGSPVATLIAEFQGSLGAFRGLGPLLEEKLAPAEFPSGPNGEIVRVQRKPYGVIAGIVPWNAPIALTVNKIVPAIAAGNTVVLKPSPLAPLGVTSICRIAAELLPPGVLNVVNGGGEVGAALIGHPRIRKISFTGGGPTARHIMRQAADSLTGVHFELGGNDPAIVLDDADLATTADRIVESAYRRAGQVCFAVKRVYVPRDKAAELSRLMVERVDAITVGHPLDERATMGPVNNSAQFAHVSDLRDRTIAQGRDVRVLGSASDLTTWDDGHYLLPMLVLDAEHGDDIVREEQFGPILPIIAYDSVADAIEMANDTDFGLCSSVWSRSIDRALDVANQIEAGVTMINSHLFSAVGSQQIPFGGWKQSGIGWERSPYGIDEYLQFHSIDVHTFPEDPA